MNIPDEYFRLYSPEVLELLQQLQEIPFGFIIVELHEGRPVKLHTIEKESTVNIQKILRTKRDAQKRSKS